MLTAVKSQSVKEWATSRVRDVLSHHLFTQNLDPVVNTIAEEVSVWVGS